MAAPTAITPGAYLQLRRQAAGLMVGEVAIDELAVVAIEGDHRPPTEMELQVLAWAFRFSMTVLIGLARGITARLCRTCGCSEFDPCMDDDNYGCSWVESDLCSACADRVLALPEGLAV